MFNTAFLRDIAANLLSVGALASVAGYMAFGPPGESAFFDFLPPEIGRFEAWRSSFGACLSDTVAELLRRGHGAACVLNADSPTLPPAFLARAAAILAEPGDRAVLGPSSDGGYYLLGLKRHHARLFEDIDWSTERVAGQTLERAAEIGLRVEVLPTWYDVDDADALAVLRGELFDGQTFNGCTEPLAEARATRTLLRTLEDTAQLRERLGQRHLLERSAG